MILADILILTAVALSLVGAYLAWHSRKKKGGCCSGGCAGGCSGCTGNCSGCGEKI